MGGVRKPCIRKSHWGKQCREFFVTTSSKQAAGSNLTTAGESFTILMYHDFKIA